MTSVPGATVQGPIVDHPAIVSAGFVFGEAPFPQCHASTIVQAQDALIAAWFGGTCEQHADVGIWVSRNEGAGWSAPVEVANGVQPGGRRHATWNPVLLAPRGGSVSCWTSARALTFTRPLSA